MSKMLIPFLFVFGSFANPLTYPDAGKWNYSIGLENGIESNYSYSNDASLDVTRFPFTTFYKVRTTQTAGYGRWFYLQSRFAYSLGFTGFESFISHLKQHDFLDYDLSLLFPLRIPSKYKITLQPQLGFAYLREVLRARSPASTYHHKLYYLAPLVGLMLGFEPTEHLSLRGGINFQFPKAYAQTLGSYLGPGPRRELRAARHSINFLFNASYQISKYFALATTVEVNSFSVYGGTDPSSVDTADSHRSSSTIGGSWVF